MKTILFVILTMTPSQAESIRREFPRQARKGYTLAEMAGRSYGVDDPYGGSLAEYREAHRGWVSADRATGGRDIALKPIGRALALGLRHRI